MLAAETGNIDMLEVLLSHTKEGLNAGNFQRFTALGLAVKNGQFEAAKMLIEARASLGEYEPKYHVLNEAVVAGSLEMTRFLLDLKANPDACYHEFRSALVDACVECVKSDVVIIEELPD